jgi:flagellar hook capping protein FlgD
MMRNRFGTVCRRAPSLAAAIGFLLLVTISSASPAQATLKGISVDPPSPTACDSIFITVAGELPGPCYEVVRVAFQKSDVVECLSPVGSNVWSCTSHLNVTIVVREPNPAATCPAVIAPYSRSVEAGRLPAGLGIVRVREVVIPYGASTLDSIVSESSTGLTFPVSPDPACRFGQGCYMLGFGLSAILDPPPPNTGCDAVVQPGGTACLDLTLTNSGAVGGVQTTLEVSSANPVMSPGSFLHAVSVEAIGRAAGFQVGWTAEGSSTKIILYSPGGGEISPGAGPIARICYSVADYTPPQRFLVFDTATIVADPEGNSISRCPTMAFAPITPGIICVGTGACDVNADGRSNLLDIIRLVRCALASGTDSLPACPDSIAARADCNADGSVDIRDVICCVRKIVETVAIFPNPFLPPTPGVVAVGENSIGFEGTARWTNAVDGVATVRIDADQNWGGTQFVINNSATPVRIRSLSLDDASARAGTKLEFAVHQLGIANVMLYETTPGARPAHTYRILVRLERVPPGAGSDEPLRIQGVLAGTSEGDEAAISTSNARLVIDEAAVAAPALLGARPNPTSGVTEIGFVLPSDARVTLHVYDVAGRLVRTLIDGPVPAGVQRARWDGKDRNGRVAVSGLYFAKLTVGATVRSERVLLLR